MTRAKVYPNPIANLAGLLLGALFVALVGASCAGCSISQAYVAADRETYEAIAPDYRARVEADPGLSDDQKARRARAVDSWEARLVEAESAE